MPRQLDNLSNRANSLKEIPYFRRPLRRARFVFSPDRRAQSQNENDEWPATSGLAADELRQANRYSLGNRTVNSFAMSHCCDMDSKKREKRLSFPETMT